MFSAFCGRLPSGVINQVECNECSRWVHASCEGIDQAQYDAMTLGTHPIWVSVGLD
jgi:hypothetical protein